MASKQINSDLLIASETERAKISVQRQEEQKEIIAKVAEDARSFINQNKADKAVDLAFRCLQESSQIFGEDSIELMPLYFELADGNLKIGRKKRAEGFLIGGRWTLLKHQPSENEKTEENKEFEKRVSKLRSRLLKSFGFLFTEIGNYHDALGSLTENIYLESLDKGPEHYSISGSYYLMGNIFLQQQKKEEALSFYNQMNLTWKKFLDNTEDQESSGIKKVEIEQACNELNEVLTFVEKHLGDDSDMHAEIRNTLSRLYDYINEIDKKEHRASHLEENDEE
ncbi:ZMYND12 [Blepharisma stoltei]|uniref:Tetratricopeptide repeat protein n=1 Tax=Blepharisma stoltei TaxID=1481888 RepID=A0AAU9J3H1_9CILI|nr:unnamed protein product [Blepharisma stoltei]